MASSLLRLALLRNTRVPKTLNGSILSSSFLRRISSDAGYDFPTEDEVVSTAMDVIQANPNIKSLDTVINSINGHPKVRRSTDLFRFQVTSKVFDVIKDYPQINPYKVFIERTFTRFFLLHDNFSNDVTKEQVTSRVLEVMKTYPKVCHSKVTEESRFEKDLGLDHQDCFQIIMGLQFEFRLCIPEEEHEKIDLRKNAINYIHNHRNERLPNKEFIKKLWPDRVDPH